MDGKQKRLTAKRALAEDIVDGRYFRREGFKSNYLVTPRGQRLSRVKIVATVVSTFVNDDGSYAFLVLDDGTETIRAKFFQELDDFESVEEGDLVLVIGKVQEYEGEIYINPEIVRKVDDPNLLSLNMAEIAEELGELKRDKERLKELKEEMDEGYEEMFAEEVGIDRAEAILKSKDLDEEEDKDDEKEDKSELRKEILEAIEGIDDGEGASYQEIIDEVDAEENDIDSVVNDLLTEGTCFEPRPGKIKKL